MVEKSVDEAALSELADAAFAFLCERTVGELIDTDTIMDGIDRALTAPRIGMLLARLIAPARERWLSRLRASEQPLSVWLPETARELLANLLGAPQPIPRALVDEMVASERVREAVRTMLLESLSSVIARSFSAAPGGRGLRGMIGFGARAAGAAGRSLFGGLGDELQRQLEERVREFVDGGVQMVQKRLAERLKSEETARLLGEHRRRAFLDLLARPHSQAGKFLAKLPHALTDGLLPVAVPHNLARPELRAALRTELDAALAELSAKPIGALLDELGLRELARDALRKRAPLAVAFVASPHFASWLGKRVS